MSLLGTLEQLNLALILQRIETYAKTGLLVIKQEEQWVELYFRDGRLMCIGPIRSNATLADRLLRAGIISTQALQETVSAIGIAEPGETRLALTLMDLAYVGHEELRTWATGEAKEVIQVLLTWRNGEVYFEDGLQPPTDRLLVALSAVALLSSIPAAVAVLQVQQEQRVDIEAIPSVVEEHKHPTIATTPPAQLSTSQLLSIAGKSVEAESFAPPESPLPVLNMSGGSNAVVSPPPGLIISTPSMCIDTSFMRPEMVLLPLDLSALRDSNPQVQITPEQWRLLTRVDGRTPLQSICQALAMSPSMVRQLTGELVALGLIQVSMPIQQQRPMNELSPVSRELITAGLGNGYIPPGYTANTVQPWLAVAPTTEVLLPYGSPIIFETESQWGNGGNGATFVPGQGWIASPQPLQPLQPSGPLYSTQSVYAPVGERR